MKYKVVTKLERVDIEVPKDATLKVRFASRLIKKQQRDVWRVINKYFSEANEKGSWEHFKAGIDEETEVEIEYFAKDKEDAQRELNEIKSAAFRHLGQATLQRLKRKFKVSKKLSDDHPTFEKLKNNLAIYQIFLDVDVIEYT